MTARALRGRSDARSPRRETAAGRVIDLIACLAPRRLGVHAYHACKSWKHRIGWARVEIPLEAWPTFAYLGPYLEYATSVSEPLVFGTLRAVTISDTIGDSNRSSEPLGRQTP